VEENSPAGTVVGELLATDEDPGEEFTYALVDSADGRFTLAGNKIVVDHDDLLDYESATSHMIRVRATDRWQDSVEKDLTILVRDLPEGETLRKGPNGHWYKLVAQQVSWLDAQTAAAANAPPEGFTTGHLATVSDAEENQFLAAWAQTYQANAWLGFSDQQRYGEWRWSDGNPRIWQDPRVVDDALQTSFVHWLEGQPLLPELDASNANRSVTAGDQSRSSNELGVFEATVSWHDLVHSAGAGQNTTIDEASVTPFRGGGGVGFYGNPQLSSTFGASFRLDRPLAITLTGVVNGFFGTASTAFATTSLRSNNSERSWSWSEPDEAALPWTTAIDLHTILPPGGYSLSASAGGGGLAAGGHSNWGFSFAIDQRSGAALDWNSGQWRSEPVVATLPYYFVEFDPPNHAPNELRLAGGRVPEHSPVGNIVGQFEVSDADQGDTFLFEFIDSASGRFRLQGDQLVVDQAHAIDYESATSHTIRVRATDQGGLSVEREFVIFVENVNEAPLLIAPEDRFVENDDPLLLGDIRVGDPDFVRDDAASKPVRLNLAVDWGTLDFGSLAGLEVRSGTNPSSALVVEGPVDRLNAALATLLYRPSARHVGAARLSLSLNDLGHTGDGSPQITTAAVTITVVIPGDADLDGDVDLADFAVLKSRFGSGTTRAEGDFSGDGRVDLVDFAILKVQFRADDDGDAMFADVAAARVAAQSRRLR
jgi:hypothetical protein